MPRLDPKTWEIIRQKREAGASLTALAKEYGVSKSSIHERAEKEGWSRDVAGAIRNKALEKLAMAEAHGLSRIEAIDAAAESVAAVIRRHRREVEAVRERLFHALALHREATTLEGKKAAFEDLKAAKISSETLLNVHRIERQAWGLDQQQHQAEIVIRNPRSWPTGDPEEPGCELH